ncbi:MAG: N-acetylmuramoyl-L-alanine amidase [Lepagella sp.]
MRQHIRHIIAPATFRVLLMTIVMVGSMLTSPLLAHGAGKDKDKDKVYTVVIDAGHGGKDFGAMDNGQNEKMINLGVAKKLAQQIKKNVKNVKVVLTRDDDTFISLQGRADIANFNKADLFISIHTNSVDKSNPNRKKVAGASVYALGHQKDANNLKVAQMENSVIELEDNYHQKYSGFDPNKDESYIIFEMAQKRNLGQSLRFAAEAQKELVATAGRADRGVKQAGFWVLWATSMPSVLVELDFICNPTEAAFLGSDDGQEKMAQALCNAVKRYFSADSNRSASASESDKSDNNKKEQKNKSSDKSRQDYAEADNTTKENDSDAVATATSTGVGTLVSVESAERVKTGGKATTTRRSGSSSARKRRSQSSRAISDKREFATDTIALKSETQYLARLEAPKEEVKEEVNEPKKEEAKGKKGKKNKKSKTKDTKAKESKSSAKQGEMMASTSGSKDSKKSDNSSMKSSTRGNRKTFVVKQSGNSTQAKAAKTTTKAASGKTTASGKAVAKAETQTKDTTVRQTGRPKFKAASASASRPIYYKIQLAESDHKLSNDDPAFGGLTPTEMFVENNHYKYTYGSSTNRREMEKKLLEIKSMVPNAIIIVDNEK